MSTRFDALDDEIRWPCVAANDTSGFGHTFAVIFQSGTTTSGDRAILAYHTSAGSPTLDFLVWGGTAYDAGNAGTTVGTNTSPISGWTIGVVTKASGTSGARFHTCPLSSGTWTHQANDVGTTYSQTASSTGGTIRVGEENDTMDFDGWIAVVAAWRGAMSDTQVEALSANLRTSDWLNHAFGAPVFLSELNAKTGTVYADLSGNGQDSTVVNGTAIDAASDPPGWTYDGAGGGGTASGGAIGSGTVGSGTIGTRGAGGPPPLNTYASDQFTRTLAVDAGWGSADVGGAWTTHQGTANQGWSVNGSAGVFSIAANSDRRASLQSVSQADVELRGAFTLDKVPTGNNVIYRAYGRRSTAFDLIRIDIVVRTDQTVSMSLTRVVADTTATSLSGGGEVLNLITGWTPGALVYFTFQIEGANPTSYRGRIWLDGSTEPTTWQREVTTDSQAEVQVAGNVGVWARIPGTVTNAPFSFQTDFFTATSIPVAPGGGEAAGADTVTVTDAATVAAGFTRSATTTVAVSDAATRTFASARAASATITVADAATRTFAPTRAAADTATVADSAARAAAARTRVAADTASVADAAGRAPVAAPRTVADAVTVTDAAARALGLARAAADAATVTDATTRATVARARTAADALTVADGAARDAVARARAAVDAATVSDAATRAFAPARAAADAAVVADTATRTAAASRAATATIAVADTAVRAFASGRAAADVVAVVDLAGTTAGGAARIAAETVSVADTAERAVIARARGAADGLTVSDAVSRTGGGARAPGDAAVVADVATRAVVALARTATTAATVTDSATVVAGALARGADDAVTVADTAARGALAAPRAAADLLSVADAADGALAASRAASTAVAVTDAAAAVATRARTAQDAVAVADAAARPAAQRARTAVDVVTVSETLLSSGARDRFALTFVVVTDAATRAMATHARATADAVYVTDEALGYRPEFLGSVGLGAARTAAFRTHGATGVTVAGPERRGATLRQPTGRDATFQVVHDTTATITAATRGALLARPATGALLEQAAPRVARLETTDETGVTVAHTGPRTATIQRVATGAAFAQASPTSATAATTGTRLATVEGTGDRDATLLEVGDRLALITE